MSTQLFDNPFSRATIIKNVVFDHIMPTLSPTAWKVLCVALRQTWGNLDPTSPRGDGDEVQISYSQFIEKTGAKGQGTIADAIQECLDEGYLLRHQIGKDEQSGKPLYAYYLNTEFELEDLVSDPLLEKVVQAESAVAPQVDLLEEEEEEEVEIVLSPEQQDAYFALLDFGYDVGAGVDLDLTREAVARNSADAVLSWIETGQSMDHLKRPARFQTVLERLVDRVPPLPSLDFEEVEAEAAEPEPESEAAAFSAAELWSATLEELSSRVRKSKLTWLKPTKAVELSDGRLTVAAPNKRTRDWLEEGQLTETIQQAVETVAGESVELNYVVGN